MLETSLVPDEDWHPVALEAWTAFKESPLAYRWERTDYVHAWMTCELISRSIADGMSAGKIMQLRQFMNDLAFTEGARISLDLQISRAQAEEDPKKIISRNRLEAAREARKTGTE